MLRATNERQATAKPPAARGPQDFKGRVIAGRYRVEEQIGKGGMGPKTLEGCRKSGAVYLHAIGGAALRFELPPVPEESGEDESEPDDGSVARGKRILVVAEDGGGVDDIYAAAIDAADDFPGPGWRVTAWQWVRFWTRLEHGELVYTVETPTRLPFSERIRIHRSAFEGLLAEHAAGQGGGAVAGQGGVRLPYAAVCISGMTTKPKPRVIGTMTQSKMRPTAISVSRMRA
mgnify:CR=1 FL=1